LARSPIEPGGMHKTMKGKKTRGMQACGAFSFMNGKSTARDEMFRQNSSPSAANSISFN